MRTKIKPIDWSLLESVPFAVLIYSTVAGWIVMSRPESPGAAWRSYEAADSKRKMLLNYGQTLAEDGAES
jgi:hypothetical protein